MARRVIIRRKNIIITSNQSTHAPKAITIYALGKCGAQMLKFNQRTCAIDNLSPKYAAANEGINSAFRCHPISSIIFIDFCRFAHVIAMDAGCYTVQVLQSSERQQCPYLIARHCF
jgi:hypothetical protein